MENEFRCPKCGSDNVGIVLRVPWSTDGLIPEQHVFLECRNCGHTVSIDKVAEWAKKSSCLITRKILFCRYFVKMLKKLGI